MQKAVFGSLFQLLIKCTVEEEREWEREWNTVVECFGFSSFGKFLIALDVVPARITTYHNRKGGGREMGWSGWLDRQDMGLDYGRRPN